MRIALFGYGKMGRMIESLAGDRGHTVVGRIDGPDPEALSGNPDVAIDFSSPDAAYGNIMKCLDAGVPVVCGTTGWLHRYDEVAAHCGKTGGAFLYASNFSLGVNLFFKLNQTLARLMRHAPDYRVRLEETHHIHKLDAPSGTAITLAEGILPHSGHTAWTTDPEAGDGLPIRSVREGEVPGTHRITYESAVDRIDIVHTAHNRQGFALGALVAAEWIVGKQGVYGMEDVLNLR